MSEFIGAICAVLILLLRRFQAVSYSLWRPYFCLRNSCAFPASVTYYFWGYFEKMYLCLLLHTGLGGCGRHLFGGDGPILDEARRAGCRYQSPCLYPNLGQAPFLELPAPPTGSDHGGGGALPIGGTRVGLPHPHPARL